MFSKDERNLSKKTINELNQFGRRINTGFFTLIWNESLENQQKIKLLISVPKKKIKKAVDRNYIKRIIRESYMENKYLICNLISRPIEIILIYNKSSLPEFNKLKVELLTLFKVLNKKINENSK